MPELRIYDEIGSVGLTAKDIAEQLKGASGPLTVHINSQGGSVADGLAIYNQLKQYPGQVSVRVEGVALSMASYIAMAGDDIEIASNGMLMIHSPMAETAGNSDELERTLSMLNSATVSMVPAYALKSRKPDAEILRLMRNETWFTAEEAVANRFADRIGRESALAAYSTKHHMPKHLASKPAGAEWRSKIEAEVARGTPRGRAASMVNKANPGLQAKVVKEANAR